MRKIRLRLGRTSNQFNEEWKKPDNAIPNIYKVDANEEMESKLMRKV